MFVRVDSVKKPLQPPYEGPYRVIDRNSKFFIIEKKNGKQDSVSTDRLKVAHIVSETKSLTTHVVEQPTPASAPEQKSERITRSGRHVRWPSRYVHTVVIDR